MKKPALILIIALFALPFLASAQTANQPTDYAQMMGRRLSFGLNRNAKEYNQLVDRSVALTKQGQDLSAVDSKLAETKLIIDRGQENLAGLTATTTSQSVREIIQDIRLSYVKIREIKLLIKQVPSKRTK